MIGAHANHYNAHSIGICYEGGLDANGNPADTRTEAQKRNMLELLKSLRLDYPDAEVTSPGWAFSFKPIKNIKRNQS